MNEDIIRIQDLLKIIKKKWKLIFMITFIATIVSVVVSFYLIPPEYETSTKVFIGKEGSVSKGVADQNYSGNDVEMYQKLLKTYAEVIKTNDLIEKAVNTVDLDLKSKEVLKSLTVIPTTDTQILEIKYLNHDKFLAKDLLDSITNEFILESKLLIPNGNVKIIENVRIPENPVSPNKKLNIAVTFLIGLMVSILLSFFLEFINNTFKNKEMMEEELGIPVIGDIPDFLNK